MAILRNNILLYILICLCSSAICQKQESELNVAVWTPPAWYSGTKKLLHDNLQYYRFSEKDLSELHKEIDAVQVLGIYYKYDPTEHAGLIPTIRTYIKRNNAESFEEFFTSIKGEFESIRAKATNFKYEEEPKIIMVGGKRAFYAAVSYSLSTQDGTKASIRTKIVSVPLGKTYLHITLIDNEEEDCSDVYRQVIEKLSFSDSRNSK